MRTTLVALAESVISAHRMFACWAPGVVVLALSAQFVLCFTGSLLTSDGNRYVHEGRAGRVGLALPYTTSPASWLAAPPGRDDGVTAAVEHGDVAAAYPPGSELLLLGTVALGDGVDHPLLPLRLLLFAGVVAAVALVWRRSRSAAAFVAACPLVVFEVGVEGHLDGLALPLLVVIAVGTVGVIGVGLALGLLLHLKPVALLLLPILPRRVRVTAVAVAVVVALPHACAGVFVPPGLLVYGERWRAHPFAYGVVEAPLQAVSDFLGRRDLYTHVHIRREGLALETAGAAWVNIGGIDTDDDEGKILIDGRFGARIVSVIVVAGVLWWLRRRRPRLDVAGEVVVVLATWLLWAPTVHPWYGLWLVGPAVLTSTATLRWAAWTAAALLPLLHQSDVSRMLSGAWHEALWPRVVVVVGAAAAGWLASQIRRASA